MSVSVVIPTLNEEENIERILKSLKSQSTVPEIIIVDGGSKDNTVQIARNHAVKVIIKENSSIGLARAIGTQAATGDIIVSTDADVMPVRNTWIENISNKFKDPSIVLMSGPIYALNDDSWLANLFCSIMSSQAYATKSTYPGCNTAFRKDAWRDYPDLSFAEDVITSMAISTQGKSMWDSDNAVFMHISEQRRSQTLHSVLALGGLILFGVGLCMYSMEQKMSHLVMGLGIGLTLTSVMTATGLQFTGNDGLHIHHSLIGVATLLGNEILGELGVIEEGMRSFIRGVGLAIVLHHAATESIPI